MASFKRPVEIVAGSFALLALLSSLDWITPAAAEVGSPQPAAARVRAAPPESWPQSVTGQFFADAFAELEGPRPDFLKMPASHAEDAIEKAEAPSRGSSWPSLISAETLADEIKMMKQDIDKIVEKKRDFIGGGYLEARNSFSAIAAVLAVIAVYEGDVRWKETAARGRDRFATVAFECKQGNDASFTVATGAAEDLQSLVSGSGLDGVGADKVDWGRIASRAPLMMRLKRAEKTLAEVSASEASFASEPERLLHEAEIVAMVGEFLQQPECEDHDDAGYRGYAATMRDAAVRAAAATRKGDFAAAQSAIAALRKSCDTCHGEYR